MGIRTLHRRTAPAPAQATADQLPPPARPPVAALAPGASTARIPTDPMSTLRHTTAHLRRRLTRIVTVFATAARTLTEPQDGSAPSRSHPHPHPHCQEAEPDATP
ncbi:hypothetical protein [Streptomyces sp. NPDC093568]|uniref:hypothetical protein n=1 Tax=Streptomyces sp. NPDC093568 TaxID=3366041 RepID=UPI00381C240C